MTDSNGNKVTVNIAAGGSPISLYDTTSSSTPVLTVTDAGSPLTTRTLSYSSPGGTASYIIHYTTFTIQTNFGCSGVSEYIKPAQLVDSVTLPDNSRYSFTYEYTAGTTGPNVTGRIASVTTPTGGQISYGYSGGVGAYGGINCADGSYATVLRYTPDGVWTYARTGSGTTWATTVTDPANNQTKYTFQNGYETTRTSFQGSVASGTAVQIVQTCYNGATTCDTAVTSPIFKTVATTTVYGGLNVQTTTNYNSYGLVTEVDQSDFAGSSSPGLLKKTITTYNTALGNGIRDRPSQIQYQDGAGHTVRQTSLTYDEYTPVQTSTPQHTNPSGSRGNVTTVQDGLPGNGVLTKHYSYFDTGMLNTATDANTAVTTYAYNLCGGAYNDVITQPSPLSLVEYHAWDCTGRVQTTTVDANNQSWTTGYNEAFWRPGTFTDPTSALTNYSYAPGVMDAAIRFNGNVSINDVRTSYDGLGRVALTQRSQGPSVSTYDTVENDYDTLGRPNRTTLPYSAAAGVRNANSNVTATVTTYDALNRPAQITDQKGGYTAYSYVKNDVLVTVGPAVAGENVKSRQLEYDGAGRLISVCEITSAAGSASCGQQTAATGFLTKYAYDAVDNLLTVTQNAQAASSAWQQRTFVFDGLGRMTSENNPETGQTAYIYDNDTTCGTSVGDLVKRFDANGNVTCYAYDVLHRNTAITYPSGPEIGVTPEKHFVYDSSSAFGNSANAKGRLAEAYTGPAGAKITDLGFAYTPRGQLDTTFETTPHSGGTYQISETYWPDGAISGIGSSFAALPTWTYTPDSEGRLKSVTASAGQNPLLSTVYNVFGPTTLNYGSADSDTYGYDSQTGRQTSYAFNINSSTETGTLTWNANGSLKTLQINDPFSAANTQTCNNTYDDLARLTSNSCSAWSNTFAFDVFGNMTKAGNSSFLPTYNLKNQYATLPMGTPSYSPQGNVLNDGSHTYIWDSEGKNTQLDSAIQMTYDAFGRWVERKNISQNSYTQAVYAPDGSEAAVMAGSSVVSYYVHLPKGAMAVYGSGGAISTYWHPDWLGTARLMTSPGRSMVFDEDFGPFGELRHGPAADSFFTGVAQIPEANDLRTFPARNLSTIESRWLSPDPAGTAAVDLTNPQSFNRYAYVLGNPLGLVDPTGLSGNVASLGGCIANLAQCKSDNFNLWEYAMYLAFGTLTGRPDPFANFPTFDSSSESINPYGDFGGGAAIGGSYSAVGGFGFAPLKPGSAASNTCGQLPAGQAQQRYCPMLQEGLNAARKALQRKTCDAFYGGMGAQTLDATQYRFLALAKPSYGAQTNSSNSVFINTQGAYATYSPTVGRAGPFGRYWTQPSIRGFILLHELGHQLSDMTGFRPDAGTALNEAQSNMILAHCF